MAPDSVASAKLFLDQTMSDPELQRCLLLVRREPALYLVCPIWLSDSHIRYFFTG